MTFQALPSFMSHLNLFLSFLGGGIKDGQIVDVQRALYNMINMLSLQTQKVFTTFPAHFPEHLFFRSWFCSFMQGCDAKSEGLGRWEAFKVKHLGAGFHEHLGIGEWSRYTVILMETLHKSHQPQEFNRLNLTAANAVKWFCELLGVQRLECATECRLAKPKLNVTLPGSTTICKKNWGGSTNRMPVWQQKFVSQPPDQIIPKWGVSKNKILLPKIFGRRVRPLVQCIPSQPCPGHCCCAHEWVRCSQTSQTLKQIYIPCIPLHVAERSCTHWRTHTMVTSIRWTSPCLFHQQMKSNGHGQTNDHHPVNPVL